MKKRSTRQARPRPDYGIDAPRTVRNLFLAGACALAAGLSVPVFHAGGLRIYLAGPTLLALGSLSLGLCASMLAYSLLGKFNIRDRMLGAIRWRGDETVLDIGTGQGLLAVGAAKRLRNGTVTALDNWDVPACSSNNFELAQRNAELEGVQDRLELRSGDACNIGFVDNSFDVVLCLLGLSALDSDGRDLACKEIARVLKPRGMAVVGERPDISGYMRAFSAAGLSVKRPEPCTLRAFTSMAIVIARKR